ncbi:MAG: hypothetical protein Sapg2KO_34360 [Saprospiraceae bacterium]
MKPKVKPKMKSKKIIQNLGIALFASLTLGLAPFAPEPHIVGKVKWLLGGGKGMKIEDYFDTLLHGLPWLFLIFFLLQLITQTNKTNGHSNHT